MIDERLTTGIDLPAARRIGALARLLSEAGACLDARGTVEEVLWTLWSGTAWPTRLRAAVDRGGAQARRAHRDLDAICALFETASRAEAQRGHTGVRPFLATLGAQEIPADTLADRGIRGDAVRLLTAHRAKGLEWRLVVVTHVQEDGWPGDSRRTTLLRADEIGHRGITPPMTARALVAEERRLFYVACTRARERLVVTAVKSPDDDGEQPSRFLEEFGIPTERSRVVPLGRCRWPEWWPNCDVPSPTITSLRRCETPRRGAWPTSAAEAVDGRHLVPGADPANLVGDS